MKSEHGSAIVYVFIGIALFGALMFLFSRGSSNKNDIYDKNSEKLVVDEFLSYGNYMETEISKLLMNGCSETDLSFYHPNFWAAWNYGGAWKYGASPPDNKCSVFDPKGGGAKWSSPPKKIYDSGTYDYLFTGIVGVKDIGKNGCPDTELMMLLQVPRATCLAANVQLNNSNTNGNPPIYNYNIYENIPGNKRSAINYFHFGWGNNYFGCGQTIGNGAAPNGSELIGKTAGCYQVQNTEYYYLYRVLMAR
jgi:hypothetical protein